MQNFTVICGDLTNDGYAIFLSIYLGLVISRVLECPPQSMHMFTFCHVFIIISVIYITYQLKYWFESNHRIHITIIIWLIYISTHWYVCFITKVRGSVTFVHIKIVEILSIRLSLLIIWSISKLITYFCWFVSFVLFLFSYFQSYSSRAIINHRISIPNNVFDNM